MARRLFIFAAPDRFVAGAMGEPGDRTFYLQARKGQAVASVGLEKAQVAALAGRMADLLEAVGDDAAPAAADPDDGPLDEPLVELFRVGVMALAWEPATAEIVIEAQPETDDGEYVEVADEATEGPDLMRVRIAPGHAREFVRRAAGLIAAGRPLCPFCGQPLESTGHYCTRTNGQMN
ncbi:MAG TPA: DUF3090 family protein [Candidatus Limnocylindria bacterium]|jgi:uncharacterized repeat protein (TIGR03847 family)